MLEYEIIEDCGLYVKVMFKGCQHEASIAREHLIDGQYTCNKCSNLYEWNYFYNKYKGLESKANLFRQCKICNCRDQMSKLVPIQKHTKNGFQFWFYHKDCLSENNKDKLSMYKYINKGTSKSIILNKKEEPNNLQKSSANIIIEDKWNIINRDKIESNMGSAIDEVGVGIQIINKSCCSTDSIKELCGVYSIYNKEDNKRYIGSTRNLRQRLKSHYNNLTKGKHKSYKLQESFEQNGENSFIFEILEVLDNNCKNKTLHLTEQKYIDISNSCSNGYNVNPIAGFYGSSTDYNNLIK